MGAQGCTTLEFDLESINLEISNVCSSWNETPGNLSADIQNESLVFPALRSLQGGGKRVRPLLTLWAFRNLVSNFEKPLLTNESKALNPPLRQFASKALRIGVATEILHCGSLIIDDIQDGSLTRRGAPTLYRQTGIPIAINVGNWMYFKAMELLSDSNLQADAVNLMCRCHVGQSLDLATSSANLASRVATFSTQELSELYLRIARNKTAELMTFGVLGVLKTGTQYGFHSANNALAEQYRSLIECYGLLFQKVDDLQNLSSSLSADKAQEDLSGIRNIVVIQMLSFMKHSERTSFLSKLFKKHSAKYVVSHPLFLRAVEQSILDVKSEIARAETEAKALFISSESQNYFRNTIHEPLLRLVEHVQSETMFYDKAIHPLHLAQQSHSISSLNTLLPKGGKKLTENALRIP